MKQNKFVDLLISEKNLPQVWSYRRAGKVSRVKF